MGFGFAAAKLWELMKNDNTQTKMSEQEKIKQRVREQMKKQQQAKAGQAYNGGNNQQNAFAIKYRYKSKAFITTNKFSMHTQVSEFIKVLASNEIGIDPAKTQVVFLTHKWSVQETVCFFLAFFIFFFFFFFHGV